MYSALFTSGVCNDFGVYYPACQERVRLLCSMLFRRTWLYVNMQLPYTHLSYKAYTSQYSIHHKQKNLNVTCDAANMYGEKFPPLVTCTRRVNKLLATCYLYARRVIRCNRPVTATANGLSQVKYTRRVRYDVFTIVHTTYRYIPRGGIP